jgi:hypothetical protein
MKISQFLAFCTLSIVAISCKKDDSPPTPASVASYLTVSLGNTWNYEETDNIVVPVSVATYALLYNGTDTTINAKPYQKFASSGNRAPEYKNVSGTDYTEYLALPAILGGAKVENVYLKSAGAVGTTWSQPLPPISYSGLTANVTKIDTIRARDITMTVKGITYKDVIQVSSGFIVNSSNIPVIVSTDIQNFYAPKVGKISGKNILRVQVQFAGVDQKIDTKTELVSVNF